MTNLKLANQNPWYVLMTLYGEQKADAIDEGVLNKNRRAWNAWAGQALSEEEIAELKINSSIDTHELSGWATLGNEIEARFAEEYRRRNPARDELPGLPSPKASIDLNNLLFQCDLVLDKWVFPEKVDFQTSKFRSQFAPLRSVFLARTNFLKAEFEQEALFFGSQFQADVDFSNVDFRSFANFGQTKFFQGASYRQACFHDRVFFGRADFRKSASFNLSVFQGYSNFSEAQFGSSKLQFGVSTSFVDCQFEKPTIFREAKFFVEYPDFSGAMLHDKTVFTPHPDYWPERPKGNKKGEKQKDLRRIRAKEACAQIRHVLSRQGLPDDEHFFFRREMSFSAISGEWWSRLPYIFYGLVSDYGNSIEKPLKLLLTTVVAPSGVFTAYLQTLEGSYNYLEALHWVPAGLGMSFSNTFKFLGLQRLHFADAFEAAGTAIHAIAGVQTVLGFVFLFFLGLGLRQRFRLR
ncbi:hypothetical protein NNA36_17790 [Shimia sp. CNT1-13L.2]|uniref:pentapeptide repeat-containing protein n=1 Tax=Shimia sp. CNT1-13L.2 TaxID=2959663 RepID=UPI0020CD9288|nr:hypothetical protein [Shimia sp. CNT1-13L.2]MCP9483819.1 hypothetical protein [Shimia sp. CNT1-13L.2]